MPKLKSFALACCLTLSAAGLIAAAEPQAAASLFDGKTFEGWEGDLKVFRIEDGAIVGGSLEHKIARNEFLCTEREYGDF
ncbi:MAG TPA: family 16 glycoside hydrolase, partial [Pirellulales bacterium]|nr:family 16 glycoside hydrolase [Pirellulales bacterium]